MSLKPKLACVMTRGWTTPSPHISHDDDDINDDDDIYADQDDQDDGFNNENDGRNVDDMNLTMS